MAAGSGGGERVIGLVLYPRFTALDIVGPYEVLSSLGPHGLDLGYRTLWIAESLEPVRAHPGGPSPPEAPFDDAPPLDVLVVPGGPGQTAQMTNQRLIGFLRRAGAG